MAAAGARHDGWRAGTTTGGGRVKPSWALEPGPRRAGRAGVAGDRLRPPGTLVAAAVGAVALTVLEALAVAGRDDLRPAMRGVLVALVALQVAWAGLALRRSAPAAMVLLLCGLTAVVAGLAGAGAALGLVGAAVVVLVARSLRWFPSVEPWAS